MYQKLDNILSAELLSKSISTDHILMQLSMFDYLDRRKKVTFAKTEYEFLYKDEPEDKRMKPWAADLVLIYKEADKKICEVIEVETINLSRFNRRIKNINAKGLRVEKIQKSYGFYHLATDIDEVRFSVAMSGDFLDDGQVAAYLKSFRNKFRTLDKNSAVTPYKVYLARKRPEIYMREVKSNKYSSFRSFYDRIRFSDKNNMYQEFGFL